jgi:two-component system chemotaxis response regulator CheY
LKSLIAEDDYISGVLLHKLLQGWGPVQIARNGRFAVEAVRVALETNEPYDLICLDIMMPEMDGHQTLKEIRALESAMGVDSLKRAKIVMTSALDDYDTVLEASRGQCDHFIAKPVRKEKLVEVLRKFALIT